MIDSRSEPVLTRDIGRDIDALADEFESALKAGKTPRIEDVLVQLQASARPAALRELLKVEIELRRARCEDVSLDDYLKRFASFEPIVRDAFHQSDVLLATMVHAGSKTHKGLSVRCPYCHNPIELPSDSALDSVSCQSCGGSFSLTGNDQATQDAATLTRLGQFELVERLGIGAFGTVWKARDTQLHRTVAIKLPRKGQLGPEESEKFFREARSAAQLRHPNIVSVHEVGRDGESVYIVSDYVQGVTLGDWLTGQQLTGREAARLCAKIAAALHYAHEHGVVHRDLKPANIMIDGDGEPHLMDFGLARRDAGEVTMTVDGQVLGTPAYMSPEQAQGESHAADRRSDVYSLGVVLFQLLTNELPFRGNARMLMHQVIHDEPPSPRKFNTNIHRDLETIALKCLEKEPARRFQTAKNLVDELHSYLEGEPIHSRPVSRIERAWRWCRRRPLVSSLWAGLAVSMLLAATIGGIGYLTTSRALAEKQVSAATAEQVSRFLTELFRSSDPIGFASGDNTRFVRRDIAAADMTARELLKRGAERIETELVNQPEVQATLEETIGGVYRELGMHKESADLLGKALEKREAMRPLDPLKIASTKHNLGTALYVGGQYEEAENYLVDALATRRKMLGVENMETSNTLQSLGLVLGSIGDFEKSLEALDEAIGIRRKLRGNDDQGVAISLATKAAVLLGKGDPDAAQTCVAEALIIFSKQEGETAGAKAVMDYQQAMVALHQEDYEKAVTHFRKSLDLSKAVLGSQHPYVVLTTSDFAVAQHALGDLEGACATLEEAMRICNATLPVKHPMVLRLRRRLMLIYMQLRRFDDSLVESDLVLEQTREASGENSLNYAEALSDRASLMRRSGNLVAATKFAQQSHDLASTLTLPKERTIWPYRYELAACLLKQGRAKEARVLFDKVEFDKIPASFAPLDRVDRLDTLDIAGRTLLAAEDLPRARRAMELGLVIASDQDPRPRPNWAAWFETLLAQVDIAEGNFASARSRLMKSAKILKELEGPEDIWTKTAEEALSKLPISQDENEDSSERRTP